jgi:hypothetical protein
MRQLPSSSRARETAMCSLELKIHVELAELVRQLGDEEERER